jgi:hypothetical protein
MAKLSADEIRGFAKGAGFSGKDLDIAVAVAFAESGGNPRSHNGTPPDNSYGLMQINMLGGMGPERRAKFNLKSNEDLYDPATNMRVARGIFKGSGWKAWTTYTRGTYKKYMSDTGDAATEGVTTSTATATPSNPINGIGDSINAFGATLFKGFANFGGIAVAIALLVLGIVLLMRGTVSNLLPTGKVAKVAKGVLKA